MSDWLQEQAARGHLLRSQVAAGQLWASDLAELGADLRSNPTTREVRGERKEDVMRLAVSRRVAQAEAGLMRRVGVTGYRATHMVAVQGGTAGEAAQELGIRTTSAMDLIRVGLAELAVVYQLSEQRLTG
jgi:DNA-directed RNA polymerase specialized sigma24 family protein